MQYVDVNFKYINVPNDLLYVMWSKSTPRRDWTIFRLRVRFSCRRWWSPLQNNSSKLSIRMSNCVSSGVVSIPSSISVTVTNVNYSFQDQQWHWNRSIQFKEFSFTLLTFHHDEINNIKHIIRRWIPLLNKIERTKIYRSYLSWIPRHDAHVRYTESIVISDIESIDSCCRLFQYSIVLLKRNYEPSESKIEYTHWHMTDFITLNNSYSIYQ